MFLCTVSISSLTHPGPFLVPLPLLCWALHAPRSVLSPLSSVTACTKFLLPDSDPSLSPFSSFKTYLGFGPYFWIYVYSVRKGYPVYFNTQAQTVRSLIQAARSRLWALLMPLSPNKSLSRFHCSPAYIWISHRPGMAPHSPLSLVRSVKALQSSILGVIFCILSSGSLFSSHWYNYYL